MGLSLVYFIYGIAFLVFVISSEPTYKSETDGDREFGRIVEHIRSNIDNK